MLANKDVHRAKGAEQYNYRYAGHSHVGMSTWTMWMALPWPGGEWAGNTGRNRLAGSVPDHENSIPTNG